MGKPYKFVALQLVSHLFRTKGLNQEIQRKESAEQLLITFLQAERPPTHS